MKCGECLHFLEFEDDPVRGLCQRYPPSGRVKSVEPIFIASLDRYKYETSRWETVVMNVDKCGEFKADASK